MSRTTAADPRFAEIESHRPYLVRYAIEKGFVQTRTDGRSRPMT